MKRINAYIDDVMFDRLKSLPGTISENLRSALYKYLRDLAEFNASASQSKKGGKNG